MSFLGGLFNGAGTANKYLMGANKMRDQTLGQISGEFQPYTSTGSGAESTLGSLLGLSGNPQDAINTLRGLPGYKFGLDQGVQAIDSSQAAKGLGQSGATLKALDEFGQNYADKNYQTYVGDLSGAAGQGLGATGTLAGIQSGLGNANANAWAQIGENKANQSNAILGGIGQLAGSVFKLFGGA